MFMQKAAYIFVVVVTLVFSYSCASTMWDREFSEEDKIDFLVIKSDRLIAESKNDIRLLNEAWEFLQTAERIDSEHELVQTKIGELKAKLDKAKKDEYYTGRWLMNQEKYIDAAIRFHNSKSLRYTWKKDGTDIAVDNALDKIKDPLQNAISADLERAETFMKDEKTHDKALAVYERILRAEPSNSAAKNQIAAIERKKMQEADAWYDEGQTAYEEGRFDEAKTFLWRSYNLKESKKTLLFIRKVQRVSENAKDLQKADAHFTKAQYFEALTLYRTCKRRDPGNALYDRKIQACIDKLGPQLSVWYDLGVKKYNEGDFEKAIEHFQKVKTVDPGYKDVGNLLDKSRQKYEAAIDTL